MQAPRSSLPRIIAIAIAGLAIVIAAAFTIPSAPTQRVEHSISLDTVLK